MLLIMIGLDFATLFPFVPAIRTDASSEPPARWKERGWREARLEAFACCCCCCLGLQHVLQSDFGSETHVGHCCDNSCRAGRIPGGLHRSVRAISICLGCLAAAFCMLPALVGKNAKTQTGQHQGRSGGGDGRFRGPAALLGLTRTLTVLCAHAGQTSAAQRQAG